MKETDVSVIITTNNRAAHLQETLASFNRVQVPDGLNVELLVVDNASTDDTPRVVRETPPIPRLPIRYLQEPRKGQSIARNTGIAATRSMAIMFTDDDVRPAENWLVGMTDLMLNKNAMAVAGGVTLAPHLLRPWMTEFHRSCVADSARLNRDNPEEMVGANMGFRREVLSRVPGFDPELGPGARGFGDDTLFSMQLLKAGYRIHPAFSVTVEHHFDASRLKRTSWLTQANKAGQTWGYIIHHWQHSSVAARTWLMKRPFRLMYERYKRRNEWPYDEGIPEWEAHILIDIHTARNYLLESRKPRRYEKQSLTLLRGSTTDLLGKV